MKILHICETVRGGTATYLNELIPLLATGKDKMQVRLLMPREHIAEVPDINPASLVFFFRPNRVLGVFFLFWSTLVALVRFRPDIVHAHSTFAGVVSRLLGPLFGAKIVYCPHGWAMDREQSKAAKIVIAYIEKVLSHFSGAIIAISDHELQKGIEIGILKSRISLVYNGLSAQEMQIDPVAWSDRKLRVLFIGRLDRQKGVDILLEASRGLENYVSVKIIGVSVVGKPYLIKEIMPHVERLGWKDKHEVNRYIASSDVVVVPSRWEGFGLVALEAMRQAKAVIASDVGGLKDIVCDEVTGYLFPSEDVKSLAILLKQAHRQKLQEMGHSGCKRFLENFTAERMARQTREVYHRVYSGAEG